MPLVPRLWHLTSESENPRVEISIGRRRHVPGAFRQDCVQAPTRFFGVESLHDPVQFALPHTAHLPSADEQDQRHHCDRAATPQREFAEPTQARVWRGRQIIFGIGHVWRSAVVGLPR
ncbi:hypothetical protein C1280_17240 [Gemmata obscuriglobus]|uniref:Uncharacterized protein n=1 Tax=Gemmata obscuriglobus TaxID=114 RepID=A0A2Z3H2K2_9BACT|nr:hypothetical protein C1280_17240 [Gemmata obscuriglobus]